MMLATRNHKSIKTSTSRSHAMRKPSKSNMPKASPEQSKYSTSFRVEVVTEDETLRRLFAQEIEKAGVVTTAGYNAVFSYFLQSQVVTEAVMKRESEKRSVRPRERPSGHSWFIAAAGLRKSLTDKVVPAKSQADNVAVNIAPRRSKCLTEDQQLVQFRQESMKKAEEQRLVDSFLESYRSRDEENDKVFPSENPSISSSARKLLGNEIVVYKSNYEGSGITSFNRTNSSSSLQLKDIFEEVDSDDDDETSSTGSSCTSYSGSSYSSGGSSYASSPDANNVKNIWLPWPKQNDGDNLLVSFPSFSGNGSSVFLSWPQNDQGDNSNSWERHYV